MKTNPIKRLLDFGQSVWLDNLRRGLMTSGELRQLIKKDGLRGVTSNPSIFEKAISGSTDYNNRIRQLVRKGRTTKQILDMVIIEDIQLAADEFLSLYEKTDRNDGFVSLEVSPALAQNTAGTIQEAKRLWKLVNRPNVMIKVPATSEGIPAIEELIADAVSVNITLVFSVKRYIEVAHAYIRGLGRRAAAGEPIDSIASVASVFVSRIDTLVDSLLEKVAESDPESRRAEQARRLLGTAAIANAKLVYREFQELFRGDMFKELKTKGGRIQRPLWASTSTKNPRYRDVLYVEQLIGRSTVNTMPLETLRAFEDHGNVARTLEAGVEEANRTLEELHAAGIDFAQVMNQLQEEGVNQFWRSWVKLSDCIKTKREAYRTKLGDRQVLNLGRYESRVRKSLKAMEEKSLVRRLWSKDVTLWERSHGERIKNRLGWLTATDFMKDHLPEIGSFVNELRDAGFTHALLLGMGGSSLCPEVCRETFGVRRGFLDLAVLDSTDPATVAAMGSRADVRDTLFIVSSKSGTTTESDSFFKYFYGKLKEVRGEQAGENFVGITDPGTPLEQLAHEKRFRHLFTNPPDIGGRYSALSYFGLVPAALIGVDIEELIERAETMLHSSVSCVPVSENPAAVLGLVMAEIAKSGRDKLTLVVSPRIRTFGSWVEQLIAESTGKKGHGILPVEGEPLDGAGVYGRDRLFVWFGIEDDKRELQKLNSLRRAGHPTVSIRLDDPYDLGQEFFRWEFATAVAGSRLGIDPFDEPNVQESKDNTKRILSEYLATGKIETRGPQVESKGLRLSFGHPAPPRSLGSGGNHRIAQFLAKFFARVKPGDYVAILAYIDRTSVHERILQEIRTLLRDALKVATTVGYGPRFLHSTGQLHKGGPNKGLFIQITADDKADLPIPGESYSFSILKQAQALGDYQALVEKKRRVINVHLGNDVPRGLRALRGALKKSLEL